MPSEFRFRSVILPGRNEKQGTFNQEHVPQITLSHQSAFKMIVFDLWSLPRATNVKRWYMINSLWLHRPITWRLQGRHNKEKEETGLWEQRDWWPLGKEGDWRRRTMGENWKIEDRNRKARKRDRNERGRTYGVSQSIGLHILNNPSGGSILHTHNLNNCSVGSLLCYLVLFVTHVFLAK